MTDVLRAEWLKLRSVRSSWGVGCVVATSVLLGALWSWNVTNIADSRPVDDPVTSAASAVYLVMQLVPVSLAVLGVLTMSAEYATGSIRATVVAASRRRTFLAKLVIVAAAALVAGAATVFAAFGLGRAIVGDRAIEGYTASLSDALPELLGSCLVAVVAALVGLGLATALRSAAGAIVGVVAVLYALPAFVGFLPEPWAERVGSVMVPNLPDQLGGGGVLAPPVAIAVAGAYVVVVVGAGALALQRRDI